MTPHDEWDDHGVNESILVDGMDIGGQPRDVLVHFDRNGFAYTMDRATGELLVAKKYDPVVNWATEVVMDPSSDQYGRPQVVAKYSPEHNGDDVNTTGICPTALGTKDQQPAAYSPKTKLFYVPTNYVCMDYEPFKVAYTAGQGYVGSTVKTTPPRTAMAGRATSSLGTRPRGRSSVSSRSCSRCGPAHWRPKATSYFTARLKATSRQSISKATNSTNSRLPPGIIGNVTTYEHGGKQYIAVLSGIGGWAGIGLAGGLNLASNAAAWHAAYSQGHGSTDEAKSIATAGLAPSELTPPFPTIRRWAAS